MGITEGWVDTALALGDRSLRTMDRIVRAQSRRAGAASALERARRVQLLSLSRAPGAARPPGTAGRAGRAGSAMALAPFARQPAIRIRIRSLLAGEPDQAEVAGDALQRVRVVAQRVPLFRSPACASAPGNPPHRAGTAR